MHLAVRGTELAFDIRGSGRDVVWGHGLSSNRAHEDDLRWFDWARLAAACRLLRYDARGHGKSGYTNDPTSYSWSELAADQLALVDALDIGHYVAAGASMGCGTALHAAVAAPDRIDGLLLVVPPTAWETRRERVQMWGEVAALIETQGADAFIEAMAAVPLPDPLADEAIWGDAFARNVKATDLARLAGLFRGAGTADLPTREQITKITVPTLILAWSGDPAHPLTTAEALADLLPSAQLSVARTWEDFGQWTDKALAFLHSLPPF
ncbi:MAG: 3-oxoadipate enol-lactonase [Acidimicrobiia bacterium]|jgi:pimeloyl-ACP methyl ester carboxylesterase|nr:3-oxoadipate enol-lactonase [Acidimicrobiia bacterium]